MGNRKEERDIAPPLAEVSIAISRRICRAPISIEEFVETPFVVEYQLYINGLAVVKDYSLFPHFPLLFYNTFRKCVKDGCRVSVSDLKEVHEKYLKNVFRNSTHLLPGLFYTSKGEEVFDPSDTGELYTYYSRYILEVGGLNLDNIAVLFIEYQEPPRLLQKNFYEKYRSRVVSYLRTLDLEEKEWLKVVDSNICILLSREMWREMFASLLHSSREYVEYVTENLDDESLAYVKKLIETIHDDVTAL
jgi:hypothetical protein